MFLVQDFVDAIRESLEKKDLMLLADSLRQLKETKNKIENELDECKAMIEQVELAMAETMTNEEIQNFKRAGLTFYLTEKVFINPKAERKQELYDVLRRNGYGDLIQQTINANSFSAFAKELRDEEGKLPTWLEDYVNIFEKITVGTRRG